MPRSSADVWRAPAGSRCSPGTRSTGTQRWSTARTHGRAECSAAQGPAYALCRDRRRGAAAADGRVRVGRRATPSHGQCQAKVFPRARDGDDKRRCGDGVQSHDARAQEGEPHLRPARRG
ncbi:hypothetical protein, conserved in T. vivax [Trypanosoma vivax Y486]|uniref:Uncharacterized protein n=1 Tax=Trypanosoma vivax (strain Y486) TaxID=1055687 RepID=F9WQ60_TRYVY|nr:hypothetical protein, conserved in T. vivax [Trypanosoma vivax Y486]|eukprot:CCD19687.1 hypothetical protein, conserved in T. vivax [Trypanosoma vivax Y486]